MKKLVFTKDVLVAGEDALSYLKELGAKKAVIVTGGKSMFRTGVIDAAGRYLKESGCEVAVYSGISKNPTVAQAREGLACLRKEKPDTVIAIGGGSPIDAAKIMTLLYDFPELNFDNVLERDLSDLTLKTQFVAVPSTSGTASEVTHVGVITYEEKEYKFAIRTEAIRPKVAILDPALPKSLPASVAAETGMDALTHALEAYVNKSGNDFTYALAKEAVEGLIEWLPVSVKTGLLESREKVHNFQCMAGMAFSNSGLGIVHGVSHAFGGKYNLAHGLANAVILPYSMDYNKKDSGVAEKYKKLSHILGMDVIEKVKELQRELNIPSCLRDAGIAEDAYRADYELLVENSMKGSTAANPIPVSLEDMKRFVDCVYYGRTVDF